MTYTVGDYCKAVHEIAPPSLAMSWDNPGLLIGSGEDSVSRAVVALDATCAVIAEAKALGAQLIVTHHPIIFQPIKSVPGTSPVYRAVAAGIAVLCAHTNLDVAKGGVNDALAAALGLQNTAILEPTSSRAYRKVVVFAPRASAEAVYGAMVTAGGGSQGDYAGAAFFGEGKGRFLPLEGANPAIGSIGTLEVVDEVRIEMLVAPSKLSRVIAAMLAAHPYEEPAYDIFDTAAFREGDGIGRVGDLPRGMDPGALAGYVMERLGAGGLKYVPGKTTPIRRVAVCGGSGADYLERAVNAGAQALVTADTKHHQLLEARDRSFTLIDAGHYATEAVVLPALIKALEEALPGADIRRAESCTEPVRYLAR